MAETLEEIAGQESGIVVYGDEVIVTNWANSCGNGGLPRLAPWGMMLVAWTTDHDDLTVLKRYEVADVREALPGAIVLDENEMVCIAEGMEIIFDEWGDIPALWGYDVKRGALVNTDDNGNFIPTTGTVYELPGNIIVIAPDAWA